MPSRILLRISCCPFVSIQDPDHRNAVWTPPSSKTSAVLAAATEVASSHVLWMPDTQSFLSPRPLVELLPCLGLGAVGAHPVGVQEPGVNEVHGFQF